MAGEPLMRTQMDGQIVENEDIGYDAQVRPFNPSFIKIRRDTLTIGQVVDMMDNNEIIFETSFQRKRDLWDDVKQSRLIESLILRLPLPAFYFDEQSENVDDFTHQKVRWQVIDGLQRCSTFDRFILKKELKLQNLEFLSAFEGMSFDELPREMQRRIVQSQLATFIIEEGTPEAVKFNIFKRINTAGLILNPQEIRNAMFQGVPSSFIAELADSKSFIIATEGKIPKDRMEDRDFITRFVAFYLTDYKEYQPEFDTFLTLGMEKLSKLTREELDGIKKRFEDAMMLAKEIHGRDVFRKRSHNRRMPINKPLFEVISSSFARLSNKERLSLKTNKDMYLKQYYALDDNVDFIRAISTGTGQRQSVQTRFREIEKVITETIGRL